jgi:hypothetical protein
MAGTSRACIGWGMGRWRDGDWGEEGNLAYQGCRLLNSPSLTRPSGSSVNPYNPIYMAIQRARVASENLLDLRKPIVL